MPRVPAGLHRQSASGQQGWVRPQRFVTTPQRHYWRHTVTALHAGASAVYPQFVPGQDPTFPITATAGPQGVGEQWLVDMVQVQWSGQYRKPPLVVQQVAAQVSGVTITPPPPVTAQVWLRSGGVNVHLLAQTTQGGNDNLSVSCPPLSAGEQIAVVWYGIFNGFLTGPGTSAWFTLRGTRYALSPV